MTDKKIKAPKEQSKDKIKLSVKAGKQERLYHDLELELTALKSYVEGCHK